MHIAILMTNTDESDFAQQHPKDGEKFTRLIHLVRPDWTLTSFNVKDGVFPQDMSDFDGVIITGSPASVHDDAPWVRRLTSVIQQLYANHIPMFGACYGHQAIAVALGGKVEANPHGWVFGLTTSTLTPPTTTKRAPWMRDLPQTLYQYGAHVEAVTRLPEGAEVVSTSDLCATTGFVIGKDVYTTQNHPEMTADFIAALIEEYDAKLPAGVGARARASMVHEVDQAAYAHSIAQFFEARSVD